jgi:hypothetical protein
MATESLSVDATAAAYDTLMAYSESEETPAAA